MVIIHFNSRYAWLFYFIFFFTVETEKQRQVNVHITHVIECELKASTKEKWIKSFASKILVKATTKKRLIETIGESSCEY